MGKVASRSAFRWMGALIGLAAFILSCRDEKTGLSIRASGTIEAVKVTIASKFSGQVEEVLVREGQRVQKGDRLVVMDKSSLEIQLRQAEAGVKLAEAQLALLIKGARTEDIRQAEAVLEQARENLRQAEKDWKRWLSLSEKESATAKQREDAETRFRVACAQRDAAEQALLKLEEGSRPEEIKAAQAKLEQAVASRDLLLKSIADAVLIAPTSGVVMQKNIEPGEFVVAGSPLLVLSDLNRVELWIFLTSSEVEKIQLGQSVAVTVDFDPSRVFEGVVTFISPEAEFTPKNIQTKEERAKLVFRTKVEIPNPEHVLKPGLPADAVIQISPSAS